MRYILDASAIIAYFRDESGADIVYYYLNKESYVHRINLCEVAYFLLRNGIDKEEVKQKIQELETSLSGVYEDFDEEICLLASKIKYNCKVSIADAILTAIAKRYGYKIVTADRRDFQRISESGFYSNFIR
ncbi:PIN domain-containing protein [Hydrogenobacter sp. T-2]|uniref:PIN domain-containing protein n=1 Tax=Pampinifervens diazotrophicum TaxID=1632018 RepID=UPI002B256BA1|nr:PIN domain-containing protein [Hydrogenobacter sp. T-2]WPM31562.1 PIN domain-containing protein [Hydrogenobacter sp. T-2]